MASEAQRIMNLSLTKIVSSRGRRGGVSLHRNLLVASVLFKARDVYAAEVAGLVVIRNGSVYDRNSVVVEETPEVADQCSETEDNIIPEHQIQETVNAVVVNPEPVLNSSSSEEPPYVSAVDLEREKENIKPMDSNALTMDCSVQLKRPRRNRKSTGTHCLKRKYTEVEQAVFNITEQSDSRGAPTKKSRVNEEDFSLNCNELSSSLTEWSDVDQTTTADGQNISSRSTSDLSSSLDTYSSHSYGDYVDNSDNDDGSKYHDIGSYQSSCHVDSCSSSNDSLSFSLSHSVLVVSV